MGKKQIKNLIFKSQKHFLVVNSVIVHEVKKRFIKHFLTVIYVHTLY